MSTEPQTFVRLFRPDATVSASTNGAPIVTSTTPRLFAEEAWRYAHMSPWLVAQMMQSEPKESIRLEMEGEQIRVTMEQGRVVALFKPSTEQGRLRLVELQVREPLATEARTYRYDDFRPAGPGGPELPWRFVTTGTFWIIDENADRLRTSEVRELGTTTILSYDWSAAIPDAEFEFPKHIRDRTAQAARRASLDAARAAPASPVRTPSGGVPSADTAPDTTRVPEPSPRSRPGFDVTLWLIAAAGVGLGLVIVVLRRKAA